MVVGLWLGLLTHEDFFNPCVAGRLFLCVGTVGGHQLCGFSVSVLVMVAEWCLLLCFWFAMTPSTLSFVFGLDSFGLS